MDMIQAVIQGAQRKYSFHKQFLNYYFTTELISRNF